MEGFCCLGKKREKERLGQRRKKHKRLWAKLIAEGGVAALTSYWGEKKGLWDNVHDKLKRGEDNQLDLTGVET